MKNFEHRITLPEQLFDDLLRQNEKSIMLAGNLKIIPGDLLKVVEITKKSGINTGRYEEFIVTKITPMPSSTFEGLAILKLQKHFQYQ